MTTAPGSPARAARNARRRAAYAEARDAGLCVSCKARPRVPHARFDIFCRRCLDRHLAWESRRKAVR